MSVEIKDKMIPILEQNKNIKAVQDILELKQYLSKKISLDFLVVMVGLMI